MCVVGVEVEKEVKRRKRRCISILLLQLVMLVIDWNLKLCGDEGRRRRSNDDSEMNMKNQILMENLRLFGEESDRSEGTGTTATGVSPLWLEVDKEGMSSEDEDERAGDEEEEQLGPGSDFFR